MTQPSQAPTTAIAETPAQRVSFDDEPLILVNDADEVIGYKPKAACHVGDGILHRAFSAFLFNADGELLLQKRSGEKPLWPLYWSNSCCSHPRKGEDMAEAVARRLPEELGVEVETVFLYKFQYHARYRDAGAEHEMCSVFAGRLRGTAQANPTEIAGLRFLRPEELDRELQENRSLYTPWLQLEWPRIREEFWGVVEKL